MCAATSCNNYYDYNYTAAAAAAAAATAARWQLMWSVEAQLSCLIAN